MKIYQFAQVIAQLFNLEFYRSTLIWLFCCVAINNSYAQQKTVEPADHYKLTFTSMELVNVNAIITTITGNIFAIPGMKPETRSEHILGFKAMTLSGQPISVKYFPEDPKWQLQNGVKGTVNISYDVDLKYLRKLPSWAALQYGFFDNNSCYIVTRDLFVVADDLEADRKMTLETQSLQPILSSWKQGIKPNTYEGTLNEFADNLIAIGSVPTFEIKRGVFDLTVATFGHAGPIQQAIRKVVESALDQNLSLFGGSSKNKSLLIITSGDEDGQAYQSSTGISTKVPFTQEASPIWANTIIHELFHLWNAKAIRTEDSKLAFLSEGFTEYYSNKEALRGGFITEAQYWNIVSQHLGSYSFYYHHSNLSIAEAGKNKSENRFAIYDGGWVAAFCLDVKIRRESNGSKSLDDVMRLLWRDFGNTGKPMNYQDLVSTVNASSKFNASQFFSQFVETSNELGYNEALEWLGAEAYVQPFSGFCITEIKSKGKNYNEWLGN